MAENQKLRSSLIFRLLLIGLAVILGWGWGVYSMKYKVFPWGLAKSLYQKAASTEALPEASPEASPEIPKSKVPEIDREFEPRKDLDVAEEARLTRLIEQQREGVLKTIEFVKKNAVAFRKGLLKKVIVPIELVKISETKGASKDALISSYNIPENVRILKVKYYGVTSYGVLEERKGNKNLLICNYGHNHNLFENSNFREVAKTFLNKGYDVLTLSMVGVGVNQGASSYPAKFGAKGPSVNLELPEPHSADHQNLAWFFDEKRPHLQPISLMLSGSYHLINHVKLNYEKLVNVGISGGGWNTTMLSPLIPEIEKSYSFAGSLPNMFRHIKTNAGDWEQFIAPIWDEIDYWDLYLLSLFSEKGEQVRSHHLFYNRDDECCFRNPSAKVFVDFINSFSIHGLTATVLERKTHSIDQGVLYKLVFDE